MKRNNATNAMRNALEESKRRKKNPPKEKKPGLECGIGSIVEFEYDGQLLIGTVQAFGRYGLLHIATDATRPMFHHVVGSALIKRIIKLV